MEDLLTKTLADFVGVCVQLGLEITEKEELTENERKFCEGLDKLSEVFICMQQKAEVK